MKRILLLVLLLTALVFGQSGISGSGVRVSGAVATDDCVKFVNKQVVASAGAACGTGAGGVTSWNSRTGAVVPAAADYGLGDIGNPAAGTSFTYATNQSSAWVMQGSGVFAITGPATVSSTATVGNLIDSGLTASQIVLSDGSKQLASGTQTGTGTVFAAQTAPSFLTSITSPSYLTTTNCAAVGTAASPSVVSCSAAPAGAFSCATNASAATCTVNTTAVTANSRIFVQESAAEGTNLSVTCNVAPSVVPAILLATKTAATGFTINMPTIAANPACFTYFIVN